MVGAFHAEVGAEPPCEVKLDAVDDNSEGDAVFFKLSKYYHDISSIMYQYKSNLTWLDSALIFEVS